MIYNQNLLIFVHIQKTAGQTLRAILSDQFGRNKCLEIGTSSHHFSIENLEKMPMKERNKFKCVMAHKPYGLHHYFSRPASYITFLREPIERTVSQFFYICRTPTNARYPLIKETHFSFSSYVENEEFGRPDNMQIRYITGRLCGGEIGVDDLICAQNNLSTKFLMFGITERFQESIEYLSNKLGWGEINYSNKNVTEDRPTGDSLSPRAINRLKNKYRFDIMLYDFAMKQFELRRN